MPIIADQRITTKALRNLERFDTVIPFMTKGITYPAISGHPDIFFCVVDDLLVASEAVPGAILRQLMDAGVNLLLSKAMPGMQYPASAILNAVVTPEFLIHRSGITDINIANKCKEKTLIHVNQAYTRCNLLVPDERLWITSDIGISKALVSHGLEVVYVDPAPVQLQGFQHGFFGGCCGVWKDKVLVNGSLKFLKEEQHIRNELENLHFEVVELHDNALFDIGSILTVPVL